jgi:hypothetical protein
MIPCVFDAWEVRVTENEQAEQQQGERLAHLIDRYVITAGILFLELGGDPADQRYQHKSCQHGNDSTVDGRL